MAIRSATVSHPITIGGTTRDVMLVTWTGLTKATDDAGEAVSIPALVNRSVQVLGTLGTGGSVRLEGSNKAVPDTASATDWAPLTDPQGNDLNMTALKIEGVTEPVLWIRPRITAGDGNTNMTVYLLARR